MSPRVASLRQVAAFPWNGWQASRGLGGSFHVEWVADFRGIRSSHSPLTIPRPLPVSQAHKTAAEDLELIQKMAPRYSDTEIAKVLSKLGKKTAKGNRWTKSSVGIIRRKHGIKPAPKHKDDGILNMAQAKRYCGVSDSTLMRLIKANILPAEQVAPFAPYEIKRSDLDSEPVSTILKTLKKTGKLLLDGGTPDNQSDLFL